MTLRKMKMDLLKEENPSMPMLFDRIQALNVFF